MGAQGVSSQTPAAAPGVLSCGAGGGAPGAGTMASPPSPASGGAVPTTPSPPRMRQVGAHCGPVTSPGRSAEDTDPGRGLWAPLLSLVHLVHADTRALTRTHARTLTDTRLCIAHTRRRHTLTHTCTRSCTRGAPHLSHDHWSCAAPGSPGCPGEMHPRPRSSRDWAGAAGRFPSHPQGPAQRLTRAQLSHSHAQASQPPESMCPCTHACRDRVPDTAEGRTFPRLFEEALFLFVG